MILQATAPACAAQRTARIVENRPIARDTYLLRLDDPIMARAIEPGQFLMIRPAAATDPLLGRPFALYDVARDNSGKPAAIDIVYLVLGRGSGMLARRRPGEKLSIWGPLGHGFGPPPASGGSVAFVAGGIGQTPFLALARWWQGLAHYGDHPALAGSIPSNLVMYYGVRTAELLACIADFQSANVEVRVATNDGSIGHHGYVTELLERDLSRGWQPTKLVGCGPHPMLAVLARLAKRFEIDCDLSLENHMACGFGACFSCVAPIREPDGTIDLKRVCVEGPVFPALSVVFDQSGRD